MMTVILTKRSKKALWTRKTTAFPTSAVPKKSHAGAATFAAPAILVTAAGAATKLSTLGHRYLGRTESGRQPQSQLE